MERDHFSTVFWSGPLAVRCDACRDECALRVSPDGRVEMPPEFFAAHRHPEAYKKPKAAPLPPGIPCPHCSGTWGRGLRGVCICQEIPEPIATAVRDNIAAAVKAERERIWREITSCPGSYASFEENTVHALRVVVFPAEAKEPAK